MFIREQKKIVQRLLSNQIKDPYSNYGKEDKDEQLFQHSQDMAYASITLYRPACFRLWQEHLQFAGFQWPVE
jgi:hypothetical protein